VPVFARRVTFEGLAVAAKPAAEHLPWSPALCQSCDPRAPCLPCGLVDAARFGDSVFTRKRVKRGEELCRTGAAFTGLYVVRSGFFKSSVLLEDGRDQVSAFHMSGEILGLDGIGSGRHAAGVTALEDSEVCIIPRSRVEERALCDELCKAMSRELVRAQAMMILLGTMRAEERLAAFLIDLTQRLLARGFSQDEFHLRMTRAEIGSYLGISLETVSRLLSRFQADGLISVDQKHIRIHQHALLKAVIFPIDGCGGGSSCATTQTTAPRLFTVVA
jgi:CRP/FNR family transcriptional regulator, anaerobic regulatory protein